MQKMEDTRLTRYEYTGTTTRLLVNTSLKEVPPSIWSLLSVVDDERTAQALSAKLRRTDGRRIGISHYKMETHGLIVVGV